MSDDHPGCRQEDTEVRGVQARRTLGDTGTAASARPTKVPLLSELTDRINTLRSRVREVTVSMGNNISAIVGEVLKDDEAAPVRMVPIHTGMLGAAFAELAILETEVDALAGEAARLNGIV